MIYSNNDPSKKSDKRFTVTLPKSFTVLFFIALVSFYIFIQLVASFEDSKIAYLNSNTPKINCQVIEDSSLRLGLYKINGPTVPKGAVVSTENVCWDDSLFLTYYKHNNRNYYGYLRANQLKKVDSLGVFENHPSPPDIAESFTFSLVKIDSVMDYNNWGAVISNGNSNSTNPICLDLSSVSTNSLDRACEKLLNLNPKNWGVLISNENYPIFKEIVESVDFIVLTDKPDSNQDYDANSLFSMMKVPGGFYMIKEER